MWQMGRVCPLQIFTFAASGMALFFAVPCAAGPEVTGDEFDMRVSRV
jgi:hypothetical protein